MSDLNSSSDQEPGFDPADSTNAQDVERDPKTEKRVNDLMGLANRRLTEAEKAKAERDAAREELAQLRAELDEQYEAERARYWQQDAATAELDPEPDDEPEAPVPMMMGIHPQRPDHAPHVGGSRNPSLDQVRKDFDRLAQQEDQRLRAYVASHY